MLSASQRVLRAQIQPIGMGSGGLATGWVLVVKEAASVRQWGRIAAKHNAVPSQTLNVLKNSLAGQHARLTVGQTAPICHVDGNHWTCKKL